MQDFKKHEQFELEVLNILNSARLLSKLIFAGGTMLRLCYGLDRYSVDLDFWLDDKVDPSAFFPRLKKILRENYDLSDSCDKRFTMLFEFKSEKYPRSLKIEIRKNMKNVRVERLIAYGPNSNIQVMVKAVCIEEMMRAKIEAFLSRGEIRDVYDIEFMLKRGVKLPGDKEVLKKVIKKICLLYTSPSPRDLSTSRMPSSA
mgnify:CR=1 FL=1